MKTACLALIGSALLFSWGLTSAAPVKSTAVPIPIEEEFVVAQQLHVDSSLDAIVMQLLGAGLVDFGAKLHYEGQYRVAETSPGVFTGSYSGILSGNYLGEDWSIEYGAAMDTDPLANKVWNLDSKGKWKKGPYAGKNFKDKGKLTEKTDNTADLDIEIETDGVTPKIKTSATGLKKEKGGGKLTVSGDFDVVDDAGKKHKETVDIVLDQASKTFTSRVSSGIGFLGFVVLENKGSYTATSCAIAPDCPVGTTSFDITISQVPEPATPFLLATGFGGLLCLRRRRPA